MVDPTQAPEGTVPEGNMETTNLDAPIESFVQPSADMLTDEVDPPLPIVDKGFGPVHQSTALTEEEMAALGATEEEEAEVEIEEETPDKPSEEEQPPEDASSEGDDVKEDLPTTVPYDRFQEVIAENQQLKQAAAAMEWIKANPEQAAARLLGKTEAASTPQQQENRFSLHIETPKPDKPEDQLTEEDRVRLFVESVVTEKLRASGLENIASGMNDMAQFKDQLTEHLTKNTVDADGKPMYPRWDELKGTMTEVKVRYSGMSDAEAYVLADRMIPQSTPMADEMGAYNQQQPPSAQPEQPTPPRVAPKKASSAARRAAKVASIGRSSPAMTPVKTETPSAEEAAARAFDAIVDESMI